MAIVSTGDELVEVGEMPLPFQIRRSNVFAVAAILRGQSSIYANKTLDDFRNSMYLGVFINTFIKTYPDRFQSKMVELSTHYEAIMQQVAKLEKSKCSFTFFCNSKESNFG